VIRVTAPGAVRGDGIPRPEVLKAQYDTTKMPPGSTHSRCRRHHGFIVSSPLSGLPAQWDAQRTPDIPARTGGELDLNPALLERGRAQELNFRPGPAASLDIYDPGLSRSIPPDLNDLGLPAPLADRRFLQRLHDPESGKDLKPDLILACQREL
jgi:hypothetical protein